MTTFLPFRLKKQYQFYFKHQLRLKVLVTFCLVEVFPQHGMGIMTAIKHGSELWYGSLIHILNS